MKELFIGVITLTLRTIIGIFAGIGAVALTVVVFYGGWKLGINFVDWLI